MPDQVLLKVKMKALAESDAEITTRDFLELAKLMDHPGLKHLYIDPVFITNATDRHNQWAYEQEHHQKGK